MVVYWDARWKGATRVARRLWISTFGLGLLPVAGTACQTDDDAESDHVDSGKADCLGEDRCSDPGRPVPICEDDEDVGCLRHGISEVEWAKRAPEFINPGWSDSVRQRWNHQDQGTKILPLSWLLALEPVGLVDGVLRDGGPILADENVLAHGLFPDHDRESNPYELPVGFTAMGDFNLEGGVEDTVFGYTCAVCHTQRIDIATDAGVKRYQIAGGSGQQDFGEWNKDLVTALVATRDSVLRKDRFIERVQAFQQALYGEYLTKDQIKAHLDKYSYFGFLREKKNIMKEWGPTHHGPGRVDALGTGFTTLHYDYLKPFVGQDGFTSADLERNLGGLDGMVSFPPVYDGPKWDWAEYGHSIRESFARNTSEAVAVNSQTNLVTLEGDVNAEGLFFIEQQLRKLQAPTYPGPIDETKRRLGRALFWGENVDGATDAESVDCARCHGPREAYDGREWKLNTIALGTAGTDPNTLTNFAQREVTLPKAVWTSFFTPRVVAELGALFGVELDPARPQRVLAGLALYGLVDGLAGKLFAEQGWDWAGAPERCGDPSTWTDGGTCEATLGRQSIYRVDIPRTAPRADDERDDLDPMLFLPAEGYDAADPRCNDVSADQRPACLAKQGWLAYRARPLHGMWAAAPFLHNDSVPNLCLLLGDPANRPSKFYAGNIEFDPNCLGYRYDDDDDAMPDGETDAVEFDTRDSGNSNRGHGFSDAYDPAVGPRNGVFGRALKADEIAALVEYIKSLPPLPPGPDGKTHLGEYVDDRYDELK